MRIISVMAAAVLVALVLPAAAQTDLDEAQIRGYLESRREGPGQRDYRTPEIFARSSGDTTGNLPAGPPATVPPRAGLKMFGYDLFGQPTAGFMDLAEAPVPEDYVLGPGDHLILNLWGRVEKSYELTVDREGKVFVPKGGEVLLWGATVAQAQERLKENLSRIYTDFQLSVVLGKIKSIRVYVFGAVKKPGAYTVSSLSTLFNVLYLCGGPSDTGSLRTIQHSRDGRQLGTVDLYDVLIHGRNVDTRLANNDVVFVPVVARTAGVSGCVRRPAIYELLGGETVHDLMELAGGAEADAYLEKVTVSRIEGNARHVVLDVSLVGEGDRAFAVNNGDALDVHAVYQTPEDYVEINGRVKYAGKFEYRSGMRVSDLIRNQLVPDSHLERANVMRTSNDTSKRLIAVNLSAVVDGDSTADILLQERDVLMVYSREKLRRIPYVSIEGEVNISSQFELTDGMRLRDVVFLAGGLKKSAFLLYAEVARVGENGYSHINRVDLAEVMRAPGGESDLVMREDDRVFIREIPEWSLHDMVHIEGEVRFPGRYALRHKNEPLSDVIERAGGFTADAFLPGAVFERESIAAEIERRNIVGIMESLQEVTTDTLMIQAQHRQMAGLRTANMRRIVVDLVGIFERGDTLRDITLRDGDHIFIPPMPSGVHVLGAVASNGTIKFLAGQSYKYYLHHAGGLVRSADKGEIRVVKSDGRVVKEHVGKVEIEIGDSIVVPKKVVERKDWWRTITNSVSIMTGALTMVYMVTKL